MQKPNSTSYTSVHRRIKSILLSVIGALFGINQDWESMRSDGMYLLLREESQAQLEAIQREMAIRLIVLALMAGLSILFLPVWAVFLITLGILVCDYGERLLIASFLIKGNDMRRALAIVPVFLGEILFSLPSSLIWQSDEMFTKAVSIGIMAAALMRLATIRTFDATTGYTGVTAIACLIAVFNSYYWLSRGQYAGFFLTTIIGTISCGYVAVAIAQNHRQRRILSMSRMALERVSEAKSRFLRQMSHELRTPLNAIIGLGTTAHLRSAEPEIRAQLGVMLASAKGLGKVLDDVLDVSAVEEGLFPLHERGAPIRAELGSMVELFRQHADQQKVQLELVFAENVPDWLSLDWDRLRQCMSNLLSNARKHVKEGKISISSGFIIPDILWIEVADTGPGIPPIERERLFEWKSRFDLAADGHGLGLAISRSLARRMGGDISYVERSAGAALCVHVKATKCPVPQERKPLYLEPNSRRGLKILVVDDIGTNRLVAASYLRQLGCFPYEVNGGPQALEKLQEDDSFDLILLDINMPRMDGIETLNRIRALPGNRAKVPIIAMTADASDRDRERYLEAGMDGYVAKPIDIDALEREMVRLATSTSQ